MRLAHSHLLMRQLFTIISVMVLGYILCLSVFLSTGFLYIALAVLELTIDQAVLKLTRIHLLLPPKRWD